MNVTYIAWFGTKPIGTHFDELDAQKIRKKFTNKMVKKILNLCIQSIVGHIGLVRNHFIWVMTVTAIII